ncbi:MAG: RidA family protein [Parvularculaceae bacterium]
MIIRAAILALAATGALAAPQRYNAPGLPESAPFSSAVVVGETIYLAGHLGRDPATGELAKGGVAGETRQTLDNMARTLAGLGAALSDVVSCTAFLADMKDYAAFNGAYVESFPGPKPARATVAVAGLALDARVEIQCVAVRATEE